MHDPIALFHEWYAKALQSEPDPPDAVALGTATREGVPSVRMVLCKGVDARGFVFYTNLGSQKASELTDNPVASLLFHWKSLARQVRVTGHVEPVTDAEADAYFASRPRTSQLGAWASRQSEVMPDRLALERRVAHYAAHFGVGTVPRPPFWHGFRVVPRRVEFWEELPFRLHRRRVLVRDGDGWTEELLYP